MDTTFKELFKLYDIIQNDDSRSVERFLNTQKVNINLVLPCKGIGVLHLAVGIDPLDKSRNCTEILLKHGGDPNLSNDDGITPVHIAAIWGRVDNLKLLVGCGGDPSRRDLDGISAFDYAVREQQWDVYDYLHNVIDESDSTDPIETECAYTLNIERVLVTTDHVVAEYEPLKENQTDIISRKSDTIRDWLDRNSLVINKLYPTIHGETYLIEDESEPWTDDTNNTFMTCCSKREVEITGVHPLELTSDKSKFSNESKQRASVYENFSLPGSPSCITHRNYNSKTSLRKLGSKELIATNQLTLDSHITDDDSQSDLDKAMIMVQNRTNEWLCGDDRNRNTRRSSASSGVSSTPSGNIMLANVHEEYKYEDPEEDVVLIERRLQVSSIVLPVDEGSDADQTIHSIASSLPFSVSYDNDALRSELIRLGVTPGPIQNTTRTLYLKKLQALKTNPVIAEHQETGKTYSVELTKSLRNDDWLQNLSPYINIQTKVQADFENPKKIWREGNAKTSFTYLLLDPRVTGNLPARANSQSHQVSWTTFINSIFYIGKGKRSRPYAHLYQALTPWKHNIRKSSKQKVQHILDIWSDGLGVICLHVFQNIIPAEAYTYEAAMIDVIGLNNLKNEKIGNYYGAAEQLTRKERRMLGLYLLYKALNIYINEGERQLRPDNVKGD
ncbi:ankyrin repeat and LEM domain-containing protein 1-like [Danaus plexippus]|uniref:ankyrin repeat and LEM domain-containing protein 1-like n=1 Tax=Danaus plexippus TaxID=13037 RepID=UPI002AB06DC8|nr:ankyrin repeat and LEM domain-containing protein 1-like [Danaus plexippus]